MPVRVAGAQLNLVVGDVAGNEERVAEAMAWAEAAGADVLLLPELALNGYPPEDLVLRGDFVDAGIEARDRLAARSGAMAVVVGFVDRAAPMPRGAADAQDRTVANAAAILQNGRMIGVYHKVLLPNYGVFDEDRYFSVGTDPAAVWALGDLQVGVSICEDIWLPDGPPAAQAAAGGQVLLNINASPFHRGKAAEREAMIADRAVSAGAPVVYLNLVGGQDELVFDGGSMVVAADGSVVHRSPQFEEDRFIVEVPLAGETIDHVDLPPFLDPTEEVYRALTTGLGDYVHKNGFRSVVLGLSGGIDSALTATIAVDALGPESVWGLAMPSRFSSQHSIDDARELASNLGIRFDVVSIEGIYGSYLEALAPLFVDTEFGVAEENLQARARGAILMAVSNKRSPMVVATGNKSEMAAGYSTLYGDMVGGYSVLKDVFKTLVYELARWRNKDGEVIPQSSIDKPPSAELRPNQKDSDSLPPYEVLDAILEAYIEDDRSVADLVAHGPRQGSGSQGGGNGRPQRVQAPSGCSRRQDHHQGIRKGPPASDHQPLPVDAMTSTVLINGTASDAGIPVTDSAVLRGDGCFEVLKAYGGVTLALDLHLDRLERSAASLEIPLPERGEIASWIATVASGCPDCAVRVVITRGSALPGAEQSPLVVVFAHPWEPPTGPARLFPVSAPWHAAGVHWDLAGAKVLSYAPNVSATRSARNAGFDDALLMTNEGAILEGPTFSVAWVVDGVVETPSLDLGILDSITRRLMLEDAAGLTIEVVEGRWSLERLGAASEAMALSTIREVQPISQIGEITFGEGPVTSDLRRAFSQRTG